MDDALERLNACQLPSQESRSYEERLSEMRAHEGSVCAIELSFDHQGRVFLFDLRTEWFDEFSNTPDEIQLLTAEPDHGDDSPISGYFSKNELSFRWLIPPADSQAVEALAASLQVQRITAAVLISRGITDATAALRFLAPHFDHLHFIRPCSPASVTPSSASRRPFNRKGKS